MSERRARAALALSISALTLTAVACTQPSSPTTTAPRPAGRPVSLVAAAPPPASAVVEARHPRGTKGRGHARTGKHRGRGGKHAAAVTVAPTGTRRRADKRPNVLYIVTDDQTVDDLNSRTMPGVTRELVRQGTSFTGSMTSYSYCCPSRASFQTGQLPQNNGVLSCQPPYGFNAFMAGRRGDDTLPEWLQRGGYSTGFTGKFINGNESTQAAVPAGWDQWRGFAEGTYNYLDQTEVHAVDGTKVGIRRHRTYTSTTTGDLAVQLIQSMERTGKPWFVEAAFVAPHMGADALETDDPKDVATPGVDLPDIDTFAGIPMVKHLSYNEADMSDKNLFIRYTPLLTADLQAQQQEAWEQRQEALRSVDRQVVRLIAYLDRIGALGNTDVVFTSDNGYELGDHRKLQGKLTPYTGSTDVPLVVRGPGWPAGAVRTMPVDTRDVTATIADLAKAPVPAGRLDGESFLPARTDPQWGQTRAQELRSFGGMLYAGARTSRYTYVEFADSAHTVELYDHVVDPGELTSVAYDPTYAGVVAELHRVTDQLVDCQGSTCNPETTADSMVAPAQARAAAVRRALVAPVVP